MPQQVFSNEYHNVCFHGEIRKYVDTQLNNLGPFVQSMVSLTSSLVVKTSSLVVKMLTALVSTISNSQVFLLKNVSSFCKCKSYSHFFSKNISVYAIFNDQSFNDTLTNDIVSFEQLGPGSIKKRDKISMNIFS